MALNVTVTVPEPGRISISHNLPDPAQVALLLQRALAALAAQPHPVLDAAAGPTLLVAPGPLPPGRNGHR